MGIEAVYELIDSPKKRVSCLWFTSMVFVFAFIFCALAVASTNDCDSTASRSCSRSSGFASMWVTLQIIALSVGGTKVLRRFRSPMAIGLLLGVTSMLGMALFTYFIHFAAMADRADNVDDSPDRAAAAFCFFLFIIYTVFAIVLYRNREFVIKYKGRSSTSYAVPQAAAAAAAAADDTVSV